MLAHAEIEAYLEDRVKQLAIDAKRDWDNQDKTSRTLLSLVAHSSATSLSIKNAKTIKFNYKNRQTQLSLPVFANS